MSAHKEQRAGILVLIGVFKLLKAAMLVAVGLGLLHLLNRDAEEVLRHWVNAVRVDPENRHVHGAIEAVTGLSRRKLEALSLGTFLYAALFIVEGVGLVLRKTWAEWLTVISTAGLLPLEVYEIVHRVRPAKIVVLVLNVAIVIYLIARLWRTRKASVGDRPQALTSA